MPVCMSICVAATSSAANHLQQLSQQQQVSPCDDKATCVITSRGKADGNIPVGTASASSSTDFPAAGCCTIGAGRVRLRPDAVYVQLGDVDAPGARCVRIVHIGDAFCRKCRGGTVELVGRIPDGDVLVHSGGGRLFGSLFGTGEDNRRRSFRRQFNNLISPLMRKRELHRLRDMLSALPHRNKILVPGGGTGLSQDELQQLIGSTSNCHCLLDSSVTLDGVTFYGLGSTMPTEETVDVLVSHSPPRDQQLARQVFQRIRPKAFLQGRPSGTDDESAAQWQNGVLLSDGCLTDHTEEPAQHETDFNKPVVIDFYTCRANSGISQEYSELMQTVGTSRNQMKKSKLNQSSECNLL